MTDHGPTPESPRQPAPPSHPDAWTAPADGLGTVPAWLRHPQPDAEPSGADRRRIWLSRHSIKLLGGAAALLLVVFFGLVGTAGYRAVQRWGEPSAVYLTISAPPGEQAVTSASPPAAAGPFDGTPAATFPEGVAGIALPAAKKGVLELEVGVPALGGPADTEDPDANYDLDHTLDVPDAC